MAPKDQGTQNSISPPSSFKGIWKYPARRDEKLGNALDWIAAKAIDDDIGNYWRVHDKVYNLESFIPHHPGGSDWISLSRGTDITESFEASHVVHPKLVEATLAKFYVSDAKHPRMSPYTFAEDGFYKTLKRRAQPILEKVGTGPTVQVRLMIDLLFVSALAFAVTGVYLESVILQVISAFILTHAVIASHNFFHLKQNWRTFIWDFSVMSSREWRVSHAFSHHLYPNTIMDAEISMFEPLFEFLPLRPKSFVQRYGGAVYSHFVYTIFLFIGFMIRWKKIFKGEQKFSPEYLINIIQLIVLILIAPSAWYGIRSWFLIHAVFSWYFLLIGLNAAHHHPDIFHDGDEARLDPDFGLCQLDAVRDRKDDYMQHLFFQLIFFGAHASHHLFPTVCNSKLHHLDGILVQTLKEFSASYPLLSQFELYIGNLQQQMRIEPRKLKKQ